MNIGKNRKTLIKELDENRKVNKKQWSKEMDELEKKIGKTH